jgi:hypothetical protein
MTGMRPADTVSTLFKTCTQFLFVPEPKDRSVASVSNSSHFKMFQLVLFVCVCLWVSLAKHVINLPQNSLGHGWESGAKQWPGRRFRRCLSHFGRWTMEQVRAHVPPYHVISQETFCSAISSKHTIVCTIVFSTRTLFLFLSAARCTVIPSTRKICNVKQLGGLSRSPWAGCPLCKISWAPLGAGGAG